MFTVIIPARLASTRLFKKPLIDIHGKAMVLRVMEKALMSSAKRVIVATDSEVVFDVVKAVDGEVCMTNLQHQSGIERLGEVINDYHFPDQEIIVNLQCDEPLIPPELINQLAKNIMFNNVGMATLATPIKNKDEIFDSTIVKVVIDKYSNALYFSRASIPWNRDSSIVYEKTIKQNYLRHIGIYAYRAGFIRRYVKWDISPLEKIEMLEQLRVLWYGEKIHVAMAIKIPIVGVNNRKELDIVRKAFLNS
ncbi:3-deoxy-manno-octulosonate cytidylyltransferase [Arsenophonus symbiont of Ornithomya chloropus]|uniref:3-deoxy-manno-octulosonate cytidylyltransferase n=1 Tax=Arsenophonus symbiont of Ornithomya chloropus TaxID=634121 RepID=UPI0032B12F9D